MSAVVLTPWRPVMRRFRKVVSEELTKACINPYDWRLPSGEPDGQVTDRTHGGEIPTFTVIADKSMTEREYAWGTCNLLDRQHSDFPLLKDLVMKQHLELMHQRSFEIYEKLYRVPRHQREVGNGWTPPALRRLLIRSSDNFKSMLINRTCRRHCKQIGKMINYINRFLYINLAYPSFFEKMFSFLGY